MSLPTSDDAGADVASPCISVCRMDPALGTDDDRARGGLCTGCLRRIDEIAAWSMVDAAGRRAILARVAERRPLFGD